MQRENQTEFQTFEDLEVYQAAREFRKAMYATTRKLPDIEKFGLASQIRRAALSLTNNIAEGHGRYHYLDQIKFVLQGRGSLQELQDDLNVCEDEKYLGSAEIISLKQQSLRVSQLIGGYIRFLRKRKFGENLALREDASEYGAELETADFPDLTIQRFNDSTS